MTMALESVVERDSSMDAIVELTIGLKAAKTRMKREWEVES